MKFNISNDAIWTEYEFGTARTWLIKEAITAFTSGSPEWALANKGSPIAKVSFKDLFAKWEKETRAAIADFMPDKENPEFDCFGNEIAAIHDDFDIHPVIEYVDGEMDQIKSVRESKFVEWFLRDKGYDPETGSFLMWLDTKWKNKAVGGMVLISARWQKMKEDANQAKYNEFLEEAISLGAENADVVAYRRLSYPTSPYNDDAAFEIWLAEKIVADNKLEDESTTTRCDEVSTVLSKAMMAFSVKCRQAETNQLDGEGITALFNTWWTGIVGQVAEAVGLPADSAEFANTAACINYKVPVIPATEAEFQEAISKAKPSFRKRDAVGLDVIRDEVKKMMEFKVSRGISCGRPGTAAGRYGAGVGNIASKAYGKCGTKEPSSNTKGMPAIANDGKSFNAYN
jgi:hypothetical protein